MFLIVFLGIGLLVTVLVAMNCWRGVRTYSWQQTTCTIESSEAVTRPEYGDFLFSVSYRYEHRWEQFAGNRYRPGYGGSEDVAEAQRLAARYVAGSSVECWVDPSEPGSAYLRQANLWDGLWILAPLVFVGVGGGSLWFLHRPARTPERTTISSTPGRDAPFKTLKAAGVMTLVVGAFFLFGAGLLVPFFVWPSLQVVKARSWTALACEIVESEVRSHSGDDGATYSVEALYRYRVDGQDILANRYQFPGGSSSGYDAKPQLGEQIPAGSSTTCYVNPDDAYDAVIERGFTAQYLFGLIPGIFALVGLGGLALAGATARAVRRDVAKPSWTSSPATYSTGPAVHATPIHTPGQALTGAGTSGPVLLEPAHGRLGRLAGLAGATVLWNGIVGLFLWELIGPWQAGHPDWFLALFLTPFVLIGLLLLLSIPYSILALVNRRPRLRLRRHTCRTERHERVDVHRCRQSSAAPQDLARIERDDDIDDARHGYDVNPADQSRSGVNRGSGSRSGSAGRFRHRQLHSTVERDAKFRRSTRGPLDAETSRRDQLLAGCRRAVRAPGVASDGARSMSRSIAAVAPVVLVATLVMTCVAAAQPTIASDRPGLSNGPFVLGAGTTHVEIGAQIATQADASSLSAGQVVVRFGLPYVEFQTLLNSFVISRSRRDTTQGFEDLGLGIKVPVFAREDGSFRVSALATLSVPTGSASFTGGEARPAATLLVGRTLSDRWSLTANLGYAAGAGEQDDTVVVTLTPSVSLAGSASIGLYAGYAGFFASAQTSHLVEAGLTIGAAPNTQVDLNLGFDVDTGDYFLGLGFARRWGWP